MNAVRVEREIAGRTLSLETGRVARQAHGAVWVQYGDTVVLATVLAAPCTRDIDYFPLYVDFREATYAAGKIPGGFFKREGRPSTAEVLTMRLIDRPIRPLFPDDYRQEVQVQCLTLSFDGENEPDLLAVIGASAALTLSHAPFQGPLGAARIGYVDGEYALNATLSQVEEGGLDLFVAGTRDAVNMIEMGGREMPEDVVAGGIAKGYELYTQVIELIEELAEKAGTAEAAYEPSPIPQELKDALRDKYGERIREAKQIHGKVERGEALAAIREEVQAEYFPEDAPEDVEPQYTPDQVDKALYKTEGAIQRELILAGTRPDGRKMDEVRPLGIEVGVLPRTHGSAMFRRGETQALVMTTLGMPRDQVIIDGIREEFKKPFYLHYNFPPFSVGEIRPIRGPSRRDYGHGMLAEKAIAPVMPVPDDFPYTVRVVSELLESNGSTSQATICGASLALMDAGVPVSSAVAGISIGMVSNDDNSEHVLLTDIMGEEDFHGDMDFKVAGTAKGITAIQLDMKARGIPQDRIVATLEQARQARLFLLEQMGKIIAEPRSSISPYAPRMVTLKIDPQKIGKVIGPGGKTINRIQDETGATIDIEDDGTVFISSSQAEGVEAARKEVEGLTAEAEVGKIYEGKVVSVRDFGAFVEILPGQDGMCHVSELDDKYVKKVTDVCQVGDTMRVKVVSVDDQGKIRLSRKAVLKEEKSGKNQ